MRVVVFESFFGGSHRAWAEGYRRHSAHDVELLTLSAENWRWRMRGGAIALAEQSARLAESGLRPEALIVSDMIDVGLLRALLDPLWGPVPTVLYFHENQLMYPSRKGTDVTFAFLNWTSALVADEIWFNSAFHLEGFFSSLPGLFDRFPDGPHDAPVDAVKSKATVRAVGVDVGSFKPVPRRPDSRPIVLWNHRWEHDKRPDRFAACLLRLAADDVDFDVVICGEEPIGGDPERDELLEALGERVLWAGFADRARYVELVCAADVVVSTADHEFFGVSIVEAMAAGVCPVLPDRLSYPELVPQAHRSDFLYRGRPDSLLRHRLEEAEETRELGRVASSNVQQFSWDAVASEYDASLANLVGRKPSR